MKTPIKTPVEGTVTFVHWLPVSKSLCVKISSRRYEIVLRHLDEVIVHPGDPVLAGDIIGYSDQEVMLP